MGHAKKSAISQSPDVADVYDIAAFFYYRALNGHPTSSWGGLAFSDVPDLDGR